MANTYTQLHIHLVFAVKYRESLISKTWREELEKYMTFIIQKHKHKLLAIYAMRDHVHIFIGYNPIHLIPDLVEELKTSSNHWIKTNNKTNVSFAWQKGYGAFAHSKSQSAVVINYILNQEAHHQKKTFKNEYIEMLKNNEVEFDNKYIFEFFDE
jgi:putative transposase